MTGYHGRPQSEGLGTLHYCVPWTKPGRETDGRVTV